MIDLDDLAKSLGLRIQRGAASGDFIIETQDETELYRASDEDSARVPARLDHVPGAEQVVTFVDQEYDLQAAAERYTRELCAYRALDRGQPQESLKKATRELAAAALRFSASAVDDRYIHPNRQTRELPSWLEHIADCILNRLAAEHDAGRNIYTGPPDPPDYRGRCTSRECGWEGARSMGQAGCPQCGKILETSP